MPAITASDGQTYQFPDEATPKQIGSVLKSKGLRAISVSTAAPPAFERPKGGTAAEVSARASQGETSKKARGRLATLQAETAKSEYEQEISNITGKAVGEAAAMLPFAAAAPFTAGASIPAGVALMGAAGLTAGVVRETVKSLYGSTEMPESGKALALSLGLDTAMGAAGEGTGRAIGAVGKTLIPKLIVRSAAKSDAGKAVLKDAFVTTRQELYREIQTQAEERVVAPAGRKLLLPPATTLAKGGEPIAEAWVVGRTPPRRTVNVEKPLMIAYESLKRIPKGVGEVGERFSGLTPKAAEIMGEIEGDLGIRGGRIAADQPLDALVRIKGDVQRMAWEETSLNAEEAKIFKQLAFDLDKSLKPAIAKVGPKAAALYKKTNDLLIIEKQRSVAVEMAERAMRTMIGRATMGGLGGAGVGYYRTRGFAGMAEGAATGAALGAASSLPPKLSTLLLEQTMSHPKAAPLYRKAIEFFIEGREGPAVVLAARAMAVAGVRDTIKEARQPGAFSMKEAVAP